MKIWSYAICWNEERMLPYYLKHYEKFCDKIIIYDNESTDKSIQIIKNHPKAELRFFKTNNQIRDDIYLKVKESCIIDAKGNADYIIVGDIDEFLYHPNINTFLNQNPGFSAYYAAGYQMVSDKFPSTHKMIYDECDTGVFDLNLSKPLLFNPNKIDKIQLLPGAHDIHIMQSGSNLFKHNGHKHVFSNLTWSPFDESGLLIDSSLKMLHYKYVGLDYVIERQRILANRLSQINIQHGWGRHYKYDIQSIFFNLNDRSIKLNL